jgi:N-acetylglucosaminyldiphosphoundecaprenol N-acetyl-beta-D-mannosaminyltransferase
MDTGIYRIKRNFVLINLVGVCALTKEEFVREVFSLPVTPISSMVTLVGIPAVISARENKKIADIYNNSTLAAVDGMPIVKMARRKGLICERCAGPDIMRLIFAEGIKQGKSHYFYGGKDNVVLNKLRRNLELTYAGININGMYSPPFRALTEEEDQLVCKEINEKKPDFLWVGIGAPKQELWMKEHQEKLQGTIMFGVGAGFDFLAGTLDKAPKWMVEASLEWLFRLIIEPKRLWRRYLVGGVKYLFYSLEAKIKRVDCVNVELVEKVK